MSAPGINFLFMGVSNVTGSIPTTQHVSGKPEPEAARLLTSWWTAALAMPYPIIPGVPPVAGLAPGRTRSPPSRRYFAAKDPLMDELQTDCFHIRSAFLIQSPSAALPPAHPPATLITASTLSPCNSLHSQVHLKAVRPNKQCIQIELNNVSSVILLKEEIYNDRGIVVQCLQNT